MSLQITLLDKKSSTIEAFPALNDFEIRTTLLGEVIRAELSNLRVSSAHTKTRGEVSGGGKKPWKQKGTGRARHGSTRSPIWVGGGVAFGPRSSRNWSLKINKKAKLTALKSILKDRLDHNSVYQFEAKFDFSKTKEFATLLNNLSEKTATKAKSTLVIYTSSEIPSIRGVGNTEAKVINANNIKIHQIAGATNVILTPEAKTFLEARVSV